jgi:nucleoside-diphosphate-sugar epimerase
VKRVLVTGARGFIGRCCLPLLCLRGFEVHAVSAGTTGDYAGVTWHRCDLLGAGAGEALLERVRPTHLLHLAWVAQAGVFWTSPQNHDWLNSSKRLAQSFYGLGGSRALGMGSCAEYQATDSPCSEEGTRVAPSSAYGQAKAAMCASLEQAAAGAGWVWTRLFHPYGPAEPAGRFIPSIIEALESGTPIACTHGSQVRDFVYVEDAAEACVGLLDSEAAGIYNVGSGEGRSLRQAAATIIANLGGAPLVRWGERPAPAEDPPRMVADPGRIRAAIGWRPRTTFDEGIRRSIKARRAAGSVP